MSLSCLEAYYQTVLLSIIYKSLLEHKIGSFSNVKQFVFNHYCCFCFVFNCR